jgi:hypothetical protein
MTDFRALCAELADELHGYASANPHHDSDDLVARARAALAAEPEGPSDDELLKLTENISTEYLCKHKSLPSDWDPGDYASSTKGLIEFARAVLARWGRLVEPEPVGPTNQDLEDAWDEEAGYYALYYEAKKYARAVLARWGSQS